MPAQLVWLIRVVAVAVAHVRALRGILHTGVALVAATTVTVGIGLIFVRKFHDRDFTNARFLA